MGVENTWKGLNPAYKELTGSVADVDLPSIRALHLADKNVAARAKWLATIYPDLDCQRYSEHDSTLFSSSPGHFQLLVLHGDDPERMAKIIKRNIEALTGKIKIALCSRTFPPDRARLLNAGFDGVFDLRMDPVEALARLHAMQRRRAIAMHSKSPTINPILLEEIQKYASKRLTQREYEVMAKLVSKRGGAVAISELSRSINRQLPSMSLPALQVFICRLRKKLKPTCGIHYNFDGGYFFSKNIEGAKD